MSASVTGATDVNQSLIEVGGMELVLLVAGGVLTIAVLGFFVVVLWRSRKDR